MEEDPKFVEWGKKYIEKHSPETEITHQAAREFASEAWNESRKQTMQAIEDAKKQEQERFKEALKGLKMSGLLKDQIQNAFNQFK